MPLKNKTILFMLFFSLIILGSNAQQNDRNKMQKYIAPLNENSKQVQQNNFYIGPDIQLEPVNTDDPYHEIGPEIPITGLTGYYDYQTNGACMHHILYLSDNIIHAIYMTSSDSLDFSGSRRTRYSYSTNGGSNWVLLTQVPNYRSGFPTLTSGNTGTSNNTAIIGNHYQPFDLLTAGIHVDQTPGGGVFTTTTWNFNQTNFIWPIISTFTNGNLLIGAETYQFGMASDTGVIQIFNPNSNTWIGNPRLLVSPATDQINMRWTTAAGPGGKGIYVLNAINDFGGTYGGNRIFYWQTSDNGQFWTGPLLLWESTFDTNWSMNFAYVGMDAIYDNSGNFYVAFNTYSDSNSRSSIWVSKNGGYAVLAARNSQITGAASEILTPMAGVCTMDWPSLSISDDGQYIFCAYSVLKQNDIINGFQSADIYYSYSQTIQLNFMGNGPVQITSGTNDERYVSLSRKAFTQSPNTYVLPLVYQKDPQPGSAAFSDNAPISRATLIYRKITQAQIFTSSNNGETGIPASFSLSQNYPNPFNPVTKIRFALPHSTKGEGLGVMLVIYDILGREVTTLVNEQLKPGTYEVEWDASQYSSGIYFYKLITNNYSETKKMLLVK